MFERETDNIIKKITDRMPSGRSGAFTVREILAANIPAAVKVFFRNDTEAVLQSELQEYRNRSRFSFQSPEVKNLQDQLNVVLIHTYRFTAEEFRKRLDDTVHMIINYLVRPQWTLTGVLFEHDEVISAEKLAGILSLFHPYEYLQEILSRYLKEKNPAAVTRDQFRALIWKADGEYIKRRTGTEVAGIIGEMYAFFDFPENSGHNVLPIRAVTKFFEDKGLHLLIPRLEGEIVQGKTEVSLAELTTILDDLYKSAGPFVADRMETEESGAQESRAEVPGAEGSRAKGPGAQESRAEEPGTEGSRAEERPVKTGTSAAPEQISPPSSLEGKFLSENIFTDSERKRIIRKIFKDDDQSYAGAIAALNKCTTWKQASKVIDEVFINFNINPYSGEAERFTSTVMKQFYRSS